MMARTKDKRKTQPAKTGSVQLPIRTLADLSKLSYLLGISESELLSSCVEQIRERFAEVLAA